MSFDCLAPHYRWMEFLLAGEKLQYCRTTFLDRATTARNILILGEGHGRFLVECRRQSPDAQITCVDSSERMLSVARTRLQRADLSLERTTFLHADALTWIPPEAAADLLVTHFFLDCFRADQLERLISQLSRAAQPSAAWLLADFQTPSAGLSKLRGQLILKAMYVFFRLVTRLPARQLTPPDAYLHSHGFKLASRREINWGLLHSDLWIRSIQ